jgi:hypothetical protein
MSFLNHGSHGSHGSQPLVSVFYGFVSRDFIGPGGVRRSSREIACQLALVGAQRSPGGGRWEALGLDSAFACVRRYDLCCPRAIRALQSRSAGIIQAFDQQVVFRVIANAPSRKNLRNLSPDALTHCR